MTVAASLRKASFFLIAIPVVLRAALRVTWLNRRHDLAQLSDHLRAVRPWQPGYLANPRYLEASVRRMVKLVPPPGLGLCLKQSLLLLDLWSRCGLNPRIHIGTLKEDGERRFHAWVTAADSASGLTPQDYAEIWSY